MKFLLKDGEWYGFAGNVNGKVARCSILFDGSFWHDSKLLFGSCLGEIWRSSLGNASFWQDSVGSFLDTGMQIRWCLLLPICHYGGVLVMISLKM